MYIEIQMKENNNIEFSMALNGKYYLLNTDLKGRM